MTPNEDLTDELSALTSIYPPSTLPTTSSLPPPSILHQLLDGRYLLHLPSTPPLTLHLTIPPTYPTDPPIILDPPTTEALKTAHDVVKEVFTPGCVIFFDLIETLVERLRSSSTPASTSSAADSTVTTVSADEDLELEDKDTEGQDATDSPATPTATALLRSVDAPPWHISAPVIEKKSTFVGRCVQVATASEARNFLADIKADRRLAKATHNISAYRICVGRGEAMRVVQDCDDDGETAAGGRLGKMLELMGVAELRGTGVLVVVSRWYGGVKLGPARFGIINTVARECMLEAGLWDPEQGGKRKKKR
ncbi:ribosomal protein S5 domain 2-like protein [Ascodesmis nigricans]|uniref:Ribosomal protein S5 domain 2-like protein n=1 Tax=Ascodesmis nigricans TaxID=341454 RepID=A0A4S2MI86_9PEZI|nr:ribosomal protein S5 domain 2-like protein [Ascodesmis nigricans]